MANIKTISTVNAQEWEVVYEVDFTDNTSGGALNTDASASLSGPHAVDWVCKFGSNSAYIERVEVVDGTGLQFEHLAGETQSHLYQNLNTAPRLMALASDIVPGLSADDVIEFQVLQESDGLSGDWQFYGLHMNDGNMASAGNWVHNSTIDISAAIYDQLRTGNGDIQSSYVVATGGTPEPGFRALRWNAGAGGFEGTSKFTDKFISPPTTTDFNSTGVVSAACSNVSTAAPVISIANGYIALHGAYPTNGGGNTPSAYTATFTKFRALKRSN